MSVLVIRRRCGVEFEADRLTIPAGRWRLCPAIRESPPAGPSPLPATRRERR